MKHEALAVQENADPFRVSVHNRVCDLVNLSAPHSLSCTRQPTSIFFMIRCTLRSLKSVPTVKLWNLCDPSYFFAVSRSASTASCGARHARFRVRSSSGVDSAGTSFQKSSSGVDALFCSKMDL